MCYERKRYLLLFTKKLQLMKKKTISEVNLNSIVANAKADKAIRSLLKEYPNCPVDEVIAAEVQLRKVTLNQSPFDAPAGKPFYAFAKRAGQEWIAMVDLASGKAALVPTAAISSTVPVTGRFKVDGKMYDVRDTMNGQPRYRVCGSEHKPRAKAVLKRRLMDMAHDLFRARISL